jgi:hypothetical protein
VGLTKVVDHKFLNKVLEQIISESTIDYEMKKVYPPFSYGYTSTSCFSTPTFTPIIINMPIDSRFLYTPFQKHCEEVYSLKNKNDLLYIWTNFIFRMGEKLNKESYKSSLMDFF